MAKKICAVLLILSALISLSACFGSVNVKTDEQSTDATTRIEDYLDKAETYFTVLDTNAVFSSLENTEDVDVLKLFVDKATAKDALPESLVKSYVDSFKPYFGDTSGEDEATLKKRAESLIKEEMVIYIAAARFGCNDITKDDEKAKAKELASKYFVDESVYYTEGAENYIVKSAIREERVRAELEAAFAKIKAD